MNLPSFFGLHDVFCSVLSVLNLHWFLRTFTTARAETASWKDEDASPNLAEADGNGWKLPGGQEMGNAKCWWKCLGQSGKSLVYIYICISIHPFIHPSIYPSIHPSIYPSIYTLSRTPFSMPTKLSKQITRHHLNLQDVPQAPTCQHSFARCQGCCGHWTERIVPGQDPSDQPWWAGESHINQDLW